jgi:hypothetical protein
VHFNESGVNRSKADEPLLDLKRFQSKYSGIGSNFGSLWM